MFMTLTKTDTDTRFKTYKDTLQTRMKSRMVNAGNVSTPTRLTLLSEPLCNAFFAIESYPVDITSLGFTFKATKDPADQYPLRGIVATLKSGKKIERGCTAGKDVSSVVNTLTFSGLSEISSVTTYYCVPDIPNQQYDTRLLAILIVTKSGNDTNSHLIAAEGSLFKTALASLSSISEIAAAIDQQINAYNTSGKGYKILSRTQDQSLKITVEWGKPSVTRKLVNVGYHMFTGSSTTYINMFTGSSTTYINNLSLIFASETTEQLADLLTSVTKITVSTPFVYNPLHQESELTITGDASQSIRDLVIAEKGSSFTLKIPAIDVGGLFSTEDIFSYTRSSSRSTQNEQTSGSKDSVTFKIKVPKESYVAPGFPACKSYKSESIIGLYTDETGTIPDYEINIPMATPCICIAEDQAKLADEILRFI